MLISIIRWNFKLDTLGARFMAPFTAMVYLAIIRWVLLKGDMKLVQKVKQFIVIMVLCSFVLNIPLRALVYHFNGYPSYPMVLGMYRKKYLKLPRKSIVVTSNALHLKYLRPDLRMIDLNTRPESTVDQTINAIIKKYPVPQNIYLDLPEGKPFENYYYQISESKFGLFSERNKLLKVQ